MTLTIILSVLCSLMAVSLVILGWVAVCVKLLGDDTQAVVDDLYAQLQDISAQINESGQCQCDHEHEIVVPIGEN